MKFFQKRWVAVLVAIVAIVVGIGLGQLRANRAPDVPTTGETALDTSLSTSAYETWIWDEAGVLSSGEEKQICLYNANWDKRYTSLLAVAAVKSVDGDIADYSYELGNEIGLGQGDALLVLDIGGKDAYLATGNDFADELLNDTQATTYLDLYLYEDFMDGNYGKGVLTFMAALNDRYVEAFGGERVESIDGAGTVVSVIVMLLILFVIINAIDKSRYNTYRRRYYGVPNPPYVFRPLLFWHGPSYGWYRRRWRQPPPPPPPRGPSNRGPGSPGGFGGTGGFTNNNRGSGFGGNARGGGFSSGSRGSGFGSSASRGSGFGSSSSRSSFGGSSRSSFGGSSRGGFGGGGSRGGGFSGGSRGGGFGGRR